VYVCLSPGWENVVATGVILNSCRLFTALSLATICATMLMVENFAVGKICGSVLSPLSDVTHGLKPEPTFFPSMSSSSFDFTKEGVLDVGLASARKRS
jgi:hypothetical protein